MSERYPGMKALAERVFSECDPGKQHNLAQEMKYFLQEAKKRGIATTMAWNHQTLHSLRALLGSPVSTDSHNNTPQKQPKMFSPRDRDIMHPKPTSDTPTRLAQFESSPLIRTNQLPSKFAACLPVSSVANLSTTSSHQKVGQPIVNSPIKPKDPTLKQKRSKGSQLAAKRLERFQGKTAPTSPYQDQQIIGTIVGTSQELEKPFFRLTGQVNPAVVRPPEVLELALPHVLAIYKAPGRGYPYITSQLQSIRQDLTVQHIENTLAIQVYEVNARIALFHDDLGEFNKCMTRLNDLYAANPDVEDTKYEFKAYSIYYMLLRRKWDEISIVLQTMGVPDPFEDQKICTLRQETSTCSVFDENAKLYPVKAPDQKKMLDRALLSIHLVQHGDLHRLMTTYMSAWPLEKKLMHQLICRAQAKALEGILSATKPQNQVLPFKDVRRLLGIPKAQLKTLLQEWEIPHTNRQIASEKALPAVQIMSRKLGGFDIKGQI